MFIKKYALKLSIAIIAAWLFASMLVDFVVVPSVFRNVANFFEAGDLGILLFSKFNSVELVLSSLLVVLALSTPHKKLNLILSLAAFAIVLTYFSYLTLKITELTGLWKEADAKGTVGIGLIPDIQQAHQYYHKIYVTLDSIKMLVLLTWLVLKLRSEES